MQAIILAAGMGKRLKHLTKDKTKCMVEVNGRTLIQRTLDILEKRIAGEIRRADDQFLALIKREEIPLGMVAKGHITVVVEGFVIKMAGEVLAAALQGEKAF